MLRYLRREKKFFLAAKTNQQEDDFKRSLSDSFDTYQSSVIGFVETEGGYEQREFFPQELAHGGGVRLTDQNGLDMYDSPVANSIVIDTESPALLDLTTFEYAEDMYDVPLYTINEDYSPYNLTQYFTESIMSLVIPPIQSAKKCVHPVAKTRKSFKKYAELTGQMFDVPQKALPHGMTRRNLRMMRVVCKDLYNLTFEYFEQHLFFNTVELAPGKRMFNLISRQYAYRGISFWCSTFPETTTKKSYRKMADRCEFCGGQRLPTDPVQSWFDIWNAQRYTDFNNHDCSSLYKQ